MRFHLGDILSITTGKLVSPDHMDGVYRILNHLTGDDLFTHQLPAAAKTMTPVLLAQFPQLATVDASGVTDEATAKAFLAGQVAAHGEWHEVTAPSSALWGEHDAMQELIDMVGEDRVIGVRVDEDTDPAVAASMVAQVIELGNDSGEVSR